MPLDAPVIRIDLGALVGLLMGVVYPTFSDIKWLLLSSSVEAVINWYDLTWEFVLALKSMTGFARVNGQHEQCSWSWELKSVNSKGLDIRLRVPTSFDGLEQSVRERTGKVLTRGNVTIGLTVEWAQSSGAFQLNQEILDLVISSIPEIEALIPNPSPTSAADVLALRGVIETFEHEVTDQQKAEIQNLILADFGQAIEALREMRAEEGARLTTVLAEQLDAISDLTTRAKQNASTQPEAIQARLQSQLSDALNGTTEISEDRMAQEIALLVTKADIREEIDRLISHEQAAHDYLKSPDAVGRKLDFLCQEFNREANTLCSKSADVELTKIGLDLKSYIERFREQIQNIE